MAVGQNRKRPAPDNCTTTSTTTTDSSKPPASRLTKLSDDPVQPVTTAPKAKAGDKDIPTQQLERIATSSRTPFEKRVLSLLCQIPRGRVSTYGLLSAHLGSSARAVGGALRRNPFAPLVPCHRVVAAGGGLGGFKGKWPVDGKGITLDEKKMLLRAEGVRFDIKGTKVLGTPWGGFV